MRADVCAARVTCRPWRRRAGGGRRASGNRRRERRRPTTVAADDGRHNTLFAANRHVLTRRDTKHTSRPTPTNTNTRKRNGERHNGHAACAMCLSFTPHGSGGQPFIASPFPFRHIVCARVCVRVHVCVVGGNGERRVASVGYRAAPRRLRQSSHVTGCHDIVPCSQRMRCAFANRVCSQFPPPPTAQTHSGSAATAIAVTAAAATAAPPSRRRTQRAAHITSQRHRQTAHTHVPQSSPAHSSFPSTPTATHFARH